ncbi:MAG TPA: hypothetical protein VFG14_14475 [Chthoniobacteraceae bacterium]|nr:hypothetical protein [Chthoniobacteraceae bacterium]
MKAILPSLSFSLLSAILATFLDHLLWHDDKSWESLFVVWFLSFFFGSLVFDYFRTRRRAN